MITRLSAIETAKNFVNDCIANGIPLEQAILFGSYSKNTQSDNSDLDLAMASKTFSGYVPNDLEKIAPIMYKVKAYHNIEPHTYSIEQFKKGDAFIDEIKKTGIKLL